MVSLSLAFEWGCQDGSQQKKEAPKRLRAQSLLENWKAHKVPAATFAALLDSLPDVQLVDVRTPREYQSGHIPGSINLDLLAEHFEARIRAVVVTDRPVLLYCQKGLRSGRAAHLMSAMGYAKLYDLQGGFANWKGKEVATPSAPPATPTVPQ